MDIQQTNPAAARLELSATARLILLVFAVLAFVGPNGLYLYSFFTNPALQDAAMQNGVALAFMIEAMMLLGLFLWYVYRRTQSWAQVGLYLFLSFLGSLAFSFPFFLYRQSQNANG